MRWGAAGALVGVVLVGGAVLAAPAGARAWASGRGVRVEEVGWCGAGLCFAGLTRGETTVARAEVGWDRVVALHDVVVDPGEGRAAAAAGAGGALPVREVRVDGLLVRGVPLPPLHGQLLPTRHLEGAGVTVDGDVARATVPSPYGDVAVEATLSGGAIVAHVRCDVCGVRAAVLAETRLDLPVVEGDLTLDGDRVTGEVRIGEVRVEVDATRTADGAQGTFRLPPTGIAELYALLAPVVPEARRADIGGTVEGTGSFMVPGGVGEVHPAVDGFTVRGVVPPGYDGGTFRRMVRTATDETEVRAFGEGTPSWLSRVQIGETLAQAVIAAEDARFRAHPGYDLDGMLAAARDNTERGGVWRGGSTLTQQLAKNLFLDGSRTYARKARELLYAVELEQRLGKARILELYLNVVEWGPGLYGAKEAASAYFLKSPSGLLPEEAAWLASILPSPRSGWKDQYLRDRPNLSRVQGILDNMVGLPADVREAAKTRRIRFVPP